MTFSTLINNITLIVALSILYSFIIRRWKYGSRTSQVISGFLFGAVAVIGMMNPLVISPGLIFDGRSIIISIAGFIGGWVTALIAALMSIIYRTWLGGPGVIMGVSVIASSAAIGIAYHYIRRHRPRVTTPLYLIGFGIIVHICMLAMTMTLPSGIKYEVLSNIAMPVILIYPLGTLLVCVVLLDLESRLHAEDALRESEEKYRSIFENAVEGFFQSTPEGKFLSVNPAMANMCGYSSPQEMMVSITDIESQFYVYPEERKKFINNLEEHGIDENFEHQVFRKDGSTMWISTNSRVARDDSGKILYYEGTHEDITKRKRAEEELRVNEKKYRQLVDTLQEGIWLIDKDSNTSFVNPRMAEMLGYTVEEMLGKPVFSFMDERGVEIAKIGIDRGKQNITKRIDFELIRKDGNRIYSTLAATPITDEKGNYVGSLAGVNDVTERKQVEDALRESEAKLRSIVDASPVPLALNDEQGNITYLNPAFISTFGYDMNDIPSLAQWWPKAYPDPAYRNLVAAHWQLRLDRLRSEGASFDPSEINIRCKDGSQRTVLDGAASLSGVFEGNHLVTLYDITDLKHAEEHLHQTLDRLKAAFGTIIQVMVSAVESRDPYTAGHQNRSADLARAIATEMGLSHDKIDGIGMACSIHDIGKLSIPAEILAKPTKLSEIELPLIRQHAQKGYEMLKDVESPWPLAEMVYQHHERMDGSGYPRNLKGEEIIMEARILAVADVVESMASHRPYRPALGLDAALEEIENNKGILYDTDAVVVCLRLFREKGFQLEGARF